MKFESIIAAIAIIVGILAILVAIMGGILFLIQMVLNN